PHPASGTLYPARAVAQFQTQLPQGQVAPLPLSSDVVNLHTSLSANPATQEPPAQSVDVHQHARIAFFHPGHGVGFQTQLFSDKGLYEHLGRVLSYSLVGNYESKPMRGAFQSPIRLQPKP